MSYSISVIIPVYNAQEYLEECINSIVESSVFNKTEVLLIDDGSKDSSGKICDSFSAKYENIKTFHIANGGVSNARNLGLDKASGEYVTFCDSDDYYINDIIRKALEKLFETKVDLLFFDFINEKKCSKITYPFERNLILKEEYTSQIFKFMLTHSYYNSSCNKFFKRDVIKQNNIRFKKGQKHGEDRDFVVVFLSVCKTMFYLFETGYFYRNVSTSSVNGSRTDYFDNIYADFCFKVGFAPHFGVTTEELNFIMEPAIVKRIISCSFSAAEHGFSTFAISLRKLFNNKSLMDILRNNADVKFKYFVHKIIRQLFSKEKLLLSWLLIRFSIQVHKFFYKKRHL